MRNHIDNHLINNHMLTNEYINTFIISPIIKPIIQKFTKQIKTTNTNKDALFWCVYNIIYPNNIINNYFLEEKNIKFKWMEAIMLDTKLYKKFINIQPFLISHNKINIETLDAICHLFNLTVIVIVDNTYIYLNPNDKNQIIFIKIKESASIVNDETYDYIINNYLHIENYHKILYSMSRYKIVELKEMAMKINIKLDPSWKKKDIYESLKNKLKLIHLNI
jgi:hypothetical protein